MTSPNTYNLLVSTSQTILEDTSAEFVAYIPRAIGLAEDRLFRLLDIDFTVTAPLTTTTSNELLAKPSNHRVTNNLYITANNTRTRLIKKTDDFLSDYWQNPSTTGLPKYYSDFNNSNWRLAPTPDSLYIITCEYQAIPDKLSLSTQTNIYTSYFPDLLYYAVLSNLSEWQKDEVRKQEWEGKFQEALASANNEGVRQRIDDNTISAKQNTGFNSATSAR